MAYVALKESTLVLVDAVKDPILSDKIKENVEGKFKIEVASVLIRPLGHSFAVEVNIRLEPEITLKETTRIVDEIQSSIVKDFKTSNTIVIPRPISTE